MKKLMVFALATAFILPILASQAMAAKQEKVEMCHVISANDTIPNFWGTTMTIYYGKIISVAPSAVPAHLDQGDSPLFFSGEGTAASVEVFIAAGGHVPAANCHFGLWPDGTIAAPAE